MEHWKELAKDNVKFEFEGKDMFRTVRYEPVCPTSKKNKPKDPSREYMHSSWESTGWGPKCGLGAVGPKCGWWGRALHVVGGSFGSRMWDPKPPPKAPRVFESCASCDSHAMSFSRVGLETNHSASLGQIPKARRPVYRKSIYIRARP